MDKQTNSGNSDTTIDLSGISEIVKTQESIKQQRIYGFKLRKVSISCQYL
jgi:hypothetical protein